MKFIILLYFFFIQYITFNTAFNIPNIPFKFFYNKLYYDKIAGEIVSGRKNRTKYNNYKLINNTINFNK